ncbi:MAG: poly(hydroxyalkanoate) granule-associated protein [Chloroflexi bacterium]|nr:MAG: poly(hydroxyalkanoate) granule-associated protein [Chloroflexota bacterium]
MADKINVEEEVTEASQDFLKGVRRVLMAGLGAVTLAQEEVEGFVSKLVDRGEIAEKDGRKLIDELLDKRKKRATESSKRVEVEIEQRMDSLLSRMNIPSKKDIDTLSQKVSELTKKVDELKKNG